MPSEIQNIRDEIKYYERERDDWKVDMKMLHAKEKVQELDNKIQELQDKLYDMEFKELVKEESQHNNIQG